MDYSRKTNRIINPLKPYQKPKREGAIRSMEYSRKEQERNGVNVSIGITTKKKEFKLVKKSKTSKQKYRYCFHCKLDKSLSEFPSLESSWCTKCVNDSSFCK